MKTSMDLAKIVESVSLRTDLKVLAGAEFIEGRKVKYSRINVLGLELIGFFEGMSFERIQILDKAGMKFIESLSREEADSNLEALFSNPVPALILTDGLNLSAKMKDLARKKKFAILGSEKMRWDFVRVCEEELEKLLAPKIDLRGTMLEVYGVGVLIEGRSSIGKSECAIDLLNRGHRLVGDDIVEVSKRRSDVLIAKGKYPIAQRMELRGVGIVDVRSLFGISAVKDVQKIEIVVALEKWKSDKSYERLGLEERKKEILGARITYFEIPVAPGRNTAILIEAAALNYRLRRQGIVPARQLDREVIESYKNGGV
ncbi:MAG: HPr(Ser) kinase/phosphatase [Elusimicrobiota bacterium]